MLSQKILIITYYWPPSGGSGVQRWLKFVKYLPQLGWKPYVFTPEKPALVQQDESLLQDVPSEAEIVRFPIWEPYDAFFKLSSLLQPTSNRTIKPSQLTVTSNKSLFQKLTSWVRGNFFVPDPKVFWVAPSVKFLNAFLKQHGINTIVTTGPPHSMHLIGYRLKKKNPSLTWVADFRDPWSEWPFLDSFAITSLIRKRHKMLERNVLTTADHVITITPYYQNRFEILSGRKVNLIPNGFDDDDFKSIHYQRPEKFTIRHVGIVYEMANPIPFIESLTGLCNRSSEFKENLLVEFVGEVNTTYREAIQQSSIGEHVVFRSPLPHKELLKLYGTTSVLLMNLEGYQHAEGLIPGKLFEYLAAGLPVLAIGPTVGDAATILNQEKSGRMFDKNDIEGITAFLERSFLEWKTSAFAPAKTISPYSRKELTRTLLELLKV